MKGNIHAIDLSKIRCSATLQNEIDFLKSNMYMYDHWQHEWKYAMPKNEVIEKLTSLYQHLEPSQDNNIEALLLAGDVAHFLYNLEVDKFNQEAIDSYQKARELAPSDYRVYWFAGNHLSLANDPVLSIETFRKALEHLPKPAASYFFWSEYAIACTQANMLSTAAFAINEARKVSNVKPDIGNILEPVIEAQLKTARPDSSLPANNMWVSQGMKDKKVVLNSYVLGCKLKMDSNWIFQPGDFKNGQAFVIIKPSAIRVNQTNIGYTFLILAAVAKPTESLEQAIDPFVGKYNDKKPVQLAPSGINKCLAYEFTDPEMYKQMGGGHLYALALERDTPDFPGMLLDEPQKIPNNGVAGKVSYYRRPATYKRLNTRLRYIILFDSCEQIAKESSEVFKNFLNTGLIIE